MLQDIWQGFGDLAGGAVNTMGQIGRATNIGQTIERADQRKRQLAIQEQMDIIKGPFTVEIKRMAARKLQKMILPLSEKMAQMQVYQPTGQDLLSPEERKQKTMDPSGYRSLRSGQATRTPLDKVQDLSKIQKSKDAYIYGEDKEGKPRYVMPPDIQGAFDAAESFVLQKPLERDTAIGRGAGLGPEFFLGQAPVQEPQEQPRKQVESKDVTPPTPKKEAEPTAPELFDWRTGEKISGQRHSFEPISEYFQMATEASPTENMPKTHDKLGLANRRAEADFEAVRKIADEHLANFNIEQSYLNNTEHYDKLFIAIREGVPDGKGGKRKLTKQEIIKILQSMGK